MRSDKKKTDSKKQETTFLNEAQQVGRASGKVEIENLDSAIASVTHILNDDAVELYRNQKEEDWPTVTMAIYCHDCRAIVPGGIGKTMRGKPRTVCGTCNSKKISMGREEALRGFYHLEKLEKKED